MKILNLVLIKVAILTSLICMSSKLARAESYSYKANALDDHGKIIYVEKSTVEREQGRTKSVKSEYYTEDGKKIGEMKAFFKSHPYLSDFYFADFRSPFYGGMNINKEKKSADILGKEKTEDKYKKKSIDTLDEMMSFPGVHEFVADYISELERTQKIEKKTVRFVIPQENDDFGFKVYLSDENSLKTNNVKVAMEAKSPFIKLFAPKIEIEFDKVKKRFVSYKGPSIVNNEKGKCQVVSKRYEYNDPKPVADTQKIADSSGKTKKVL